MVIPRQGMNLWNFEEKEKGGWWARSCRAGRHTRRTTQTERVGGWLKEGNQKEADNFVTGQLINKWANGGLKKKPRERVFAYPVFSFL